MQITRLERTVCCVPFLPGILPPPEYDEPAHRAIPSRSRRGVKTSSGSTPTKD